MTTDAQRHRPASEPQSPPEGFVLVEGSGPFMSTLGPEYFKHTEDGLIIALRIAEQHLNRSGIAHGGMLVTLADHALSVCLARSRKPWLRTVTASLATDFVDAARLGDWVEAHVDIQKVGRRLAYANCYLKVGKRRILRASGVFAVIDSGKPDEISEG